MRGYEHPCGMECLQKLSKPNGCQATNYQKPPRAYMVNIYGINLFNFFNSYTKDVFFTFWKVFGLGINAVMDQKTIEKIQPTLDLLNEDAWRHFQSNVYTHDLMWLRSQFIIRPIHELMGHSHMVSMTRSPFLVCFVILHACHKHWRTTYGPN
jgi:hypothetical protein